MQLPTQQQFVADCLSKYRWEPLPADQQWEDAHYPLPDCLGGEDTVMLWSADHAVQGLLQSVELDHKCFNELGHKNDTDLLTVHYPEYLPLFQQLKSQFASRHGKKLSELGIGVHALNKEQLSENGRKGGKNCKVRGAGIHADPGRGGRDPETHSQHSRKAGLATKERKAGWFSRTPEEHSTDSRKGIANTNLQVWEDPYDNFRGNPGHVAKHMRAHGRNPMEKVRVI